ncbi:MAG: AbrB family transcriptional regulator [Gammaproteobacteria bacterium RIFCSPHIGHO2_02_FULL_39_13]|nr:MAG: AbrB family transcriptional regulator [Gammaproteobacteria bacterium RIFCSPHIGHO2_02_FULL_39_13]OGT49665.1 MAG: AbrB family transcriptional regulator [Gammaproteobacteria bacterium RIFCSPHIGHO2_12_FULL_39_24]
MTKVHIRKQGGAAIITIPSAILSELRLRIGAELELEVANESFIVRPAKRKRRRYTLKELFKGMTPKKMQALNKATEWAREGKPVGREVA